MSLDFTLKKYRELCQAIKDSQHNSITVFDYLSAPKSNSMCVVLRHDVDRKPGNALRMAKAEQEAGIKTTYYFRFNKIVFHPYLIKEISSMGHEIGYHYETLDKAKGNHEMAIQLFQYELDEFRKVTEIKTICMHGNPLTEWDNRDLWKMYDFMDFGIIGEAYLSFKKVVYLSDTGRTWDNRHKVKDWLPAHADKSNHASIKPAVKTTDDVIKLVKNGQTGPIYLLTHPERWSNSSAGWTTTLALDAGVNVGKGILKLMRNSRRSRRENGN